MTIIHLRVYYLYIKHGAECEWACDSRIPRPKNTTTQTDEMFDTLEFVDHRFDMINLGIYSKKLIAQYKEEIDSVRHQLAPEVFDLIQNKYEKTK
ncbi:MAG: hypothetical protein ACI8ZM_002426 [Crocinitomix sp.]|jgi:hypothetical protein